MPNDTNDSDTFRDLLAAIHDPRSGGEGPFIEIHTCLSMIWERLDRIEARIADFDFADAADLTLWRNDCTDRGWRMPDPRDGAPWTDKETADLLAARGTASLDDLSAIHGRSANAIEAHFAAHGAQAVPAC